ncbi:O-methyltransferase MdmC-like isoform X2 [Benincasa hispida]|uniref:O-methyltransferase MdmC-like isoform X2 n=1 Tax=Benincasa hispida TaxID=102211 RepID=UPI0019023605|nr:O-methyltransferase MdmC-like isoform X2 [Benincasa hispida]
MASRRAYRYLMSSSNMVLHFMSHPQKNLLIKFSSLFPVTAISSIKTVKGAFSCSCCVGCQFNLDGFSSKKRHLEKVHSTNSNEKFSNKQFISVDPQLYDYILSNVREPEILGQLREETASMRGSQMQVSPDQAQLLAMLVQILGAKRCIEVGVYTGYSSLAVALVLPESGRLVACERDLKYLEVAKRYYEVAGVSHKVDVRHGLAADTLKSLISNGEACSYDFAFIDAEKRMNEEYFELLLQLVRVGGLIVIDNVLWYGKVADPMVNDKKTDSIRRLNKKIMEDNRVRISMVPIGDGITICQKR